MPGDRQSSAASSTAQEVHDLAQGLGLLVHNSLHHHWFSPRDEKETLAAFFALVARCLKGSTELAFRVTGTVLTINGQVPRNDEHYVKTLMAQLQSHGVGNVAMRQGISIAEVGHLVALLASEPADVQKEGGFAALLSARGGEHVTSRAMVYRELSDDEVVVSRRAFDGVSSTLGLSPDAMLAHLQSTAAGAVPEAARAAADKLSNDANRLASLVVQAAQVRSTPEEGLGGTLVACLRRMFQALLESNAAGTRAGRKRLQRNLRQLESEVLKLVGSTMGSDPASCETGVRRAVADFDQQLEVETLAVEYRRRLGALTQAEERLRVFLAEHGPASLRDEALAARLLGVGPVPPGGFSGPGAGPGTAGGGAGETLAPLLTRMGSAAADQAAHGDSQELSRVLAEVQTEIARLAERAAAHIRAVADEIHTDSEAAEEAEAVARQEGRGPRLTRRRLLELLAEAVQELCQPLAVIQCSVDMIHSRMLGDLTIAQTDTVALMKESVARLESLVNGLRQVAGVPSGLAPDRDVLRQVTL